MQKGKGKAVKELTIAGLVAAAVFDVINSMEIPLWVFPAIYFADILLCIYGIYNGVPLHITDAVPVICMVLTVIAVKAAYKEKCFGGADAMAFVAIAAAFGWEAAKIIGISAMFQIAYYFYRRTIMNMGGRYPLLPLIALSAVLYYIVDTFM